MQWLGIMFMAVLLAIAPGYGSAQQQKDKPPATRSQSPEVKGEPAGTAKSFTPAERQSYEKNTAQELEAIQQKIADLRVKATTGSPQMKRLLIQSANRLQMQKTAAGNQLTALQKASEKAWGQQKADLDKAMADLRKAWEANEAYLR
ncbi:MAG: hypothetical protein AB1424_17735 [Thermodesulfobacteriota bacterium]